MNDKFQNILPGEGSASAEKATREGVTTLNRHPGHLIVEKFSNNVLLFHCPVAEIIPRLLDATLSSDVTLAAQHLRYSKDSALDRFDRYSLWSAWLDNNGAGKLSKEEDRRMFWGEVTTPFLGEKVIITPDHKAPAKINPAPMLVIERICDAQVVDENARFNLYLNDDKCSMPLLATSYNHCVIAAQQLKFSKTLPIDDDARYDIWRHWLRQFDRIPGTPEKTKSLWDSYREPGNNRFMCDIFAQYKALNGMDNGTTMQLAPMPYQAEAMRRIAEHGDKFVSQIASNRGLDNSLLKETLTGRFEAEREAERRAAMTIQELINDGSFTTRLAQQRLSRHPALCEQPEFADLVEGELDGHTDSLKALQRIIHGLNRHAGWWTDLETGEDVLSWPMKFQILWVMSKLLLIVTEVAEATEGHRKNLMDDKLPHRPMLEVELADAVIRAFDLAGGLGLDLAGAMIEKLAYNSVREDHTVEHRSGDHGKKY